MYPKIGRTFVTGVLLTVIWLSTPETHAAPVTWTVKACRGCRQMTPKEKMPLLVLIFVAGLAAASASPTRAVQSAQATELPRETGWINDLEIVVRHGRGRKPSHIHRNFSPIRSRTEGDTLIIEGSVLEMPARKAAALTTTLGRIPPQDTWEGGDIELPEE